MCPMLYVRREIVGFSGRESEVGGWRMDSDVATVSVVEEVEGYTSASFRWAGAGSWEALTFFMYEYMFGLL